MPSLKITRALKCKPSAGADPGKMKGGLVERGEATQGVGMGGGASPSRLAGGEIFCFLQFAHTFTFELSY